MDFLNIYMCNTVQNMLYNQIALYTHKKWYLVRSNWKSLNKMKSQASPRLARSLLHIETKHAKTVTSASQTMLWKILTPLRDLPNHDMRENADDSWNVLVNTSVLCNTQIACGCLTTRSQTFVLLPANQRTSKNAMEWNRVLKFVCIFMSNVQKIRK
ncbi:hypothetical protein M758_UG144200 [Ceratodon purpureus]|nr:hypothetical protein M758_UG144200 [Ceratodon purpureus]